MKTSSRVKSVKSIVFLAAFAALMLIGCASEEPAASGIGASGGTVDGPNGVSLVIPAGALDHEVQITIELAEANAASDETSVIGSVYRFGPEGTTFAQPVEVRLPYDGAGPAQVFWSHEGDLSSFSSVASERDGALLVAHVSHFSLGYVGSSRRSAFCAPVPTECSTMTNGAAQSACDFGEPGAMSPGYCFVRYDGAGAATGGQCASYGCAGAETCRNRIDDDCDGVVDNGCPGECTTDADCGAGFICDGGYCADCASATNECTAANGTPDAMCPVNIEGTTSSGVCLHRVDGAGAACGTVCSSDLATATDETCGNHIDDDNDGTVDDGCNNECVNDTGCAAGEICNFGFCASCATATNECTAANGVLDSACQVATGEGTTADGPCLRIVDSSGGACGSVCSPSIALPTEQCGNHIDDDNDGVVDNGCLKCTSDAICGAGQFCPA